MEIAQIIPHVESLIFASDHPLPAMEIMTLLNNSQGFLEDVATPDQVMSAIEAVREKYNSEFYAFEVKESGGGFQFLTKSDFFPTVAQLNGDKYLKRLSTAAMETLAIIAYKQPITKGEIEAIRGVNSDYSIQKLLEKDLIVISGRREDIAGKPLVYITSKSFMDYFGINSPEDLPQIKEILQEELVNPTMLHDVPEAGAENLPETEASDDGPGSLAVSENGELLVQESLQSLPEASVNHEDPSSVTSEFTAVEDVEAEQTGENPTETSDDASDDIAESETNPNGDPENEASYRNPEDEDEENDEDDEEEEDDDDDDDEEEEDDDDDDDDEEEDDDDDDEEEEDDDDNDDDEDEDDDDDDSEEEEDDDDDDEEEENDDEKEDEDEEGPAKLN